MSGPTPARPDGGWIDIDALVAQMDRDEPLECRRLWINAWVDSQPADQREADRRRRFDRTTSPEGVS